MAKAPPTFVDDGTPAWLTRFRALALALPEVSEQDHWGRPSFRVNKRIFATLWPDAGKAMLKLTPDQQDDLVDGRPQTLFPVPGTWGLQGATFIQLRGKGAASPALLRTLLEAAWRNAAPKSLAKALGDSAKMPDRRLK